MKPATRQQPGLERDSGVRTFALMLCLSTFRPALAHPREDSWRLGIETPIVRPSTDTAVRIPHRASQGQCCKELPAPSLEILRPSWFLLLSHTLVTRPRAEVSFLLRGYVQSYCQSGGSRCLRCSLPQPLRQAVGEGFWMKPQEVPGSLSLYPRKDLLHFPRLSSEKAFRF